MIAIFTSADQGILRLRPKATVETLLLATSLFWAAAVNRPFFAAALKGQEQGALVFALALFAGLVALHFLLLAPWATRHSTKPLLALLIVTTAAASFFMQRLGIYLDPSMLQNVLRTDSHEAGELLVWSLLPHLLLYAGLPLLLLWRVQLVPRRSWLKTLGWRLAAMAAALLLLVGAVLAQFQPLASLMRTQKEVRYLITPANYLWSLASVAGLNARAAAGPKQTLGLDARPGPLAAARSKPLVVLMVVGETARAANWGLNGYARQTTPELAALPVISFGEVTSCGTNTEVSLPCMFAPVGRRNYDETRIRGSESLLPLLQRAGVGVLWRDNQSGCKGVCDGVPSEQMQDLNPPGLCSDGRCLDEALLQGLDEKLAAAGHTQPGTQLIVMHQLGNHGPSYFRRYPPAFERFQPACRSDDLRRCSQQEIVNAYDNALLYTDHVLARAIQTLRARAGQVDSALLYVSDHGESLGENNLYLHGLPYSIAPLVQKRVPMLLWLSDGFASASGIDADCLRQRATQPAAHDHLFHTLLSLLDVQTGVHDTDWDLTRSCRRSSATP
ncbi:MAG: phosphoethanolamine--lipid A transferase [Rubrivivax sp.]